MPRPFFALDVDGTIFKSSLAEKIVEHGIAEGLFDAESFHEVYENRQRWQEDNTEDIYQAYLKQLVGVLVVQMTGVEVERFDAVTASMLKKHDDRKFRLPRIMIEALRDTHTTIVISGSPEVLVRPFVADLHVDQVYGSTYEIENGRFTGEAKSVVKKGDLLRGLVQEGIISQQGSVAMGDTVGDVPMLDYADHPVMFNASETLTRYGEGQGWDKAFEVKDNITILRKSSLFGIYTERELKEFLDTLRRIDERSEPLANH